MARQRHQPEEEHLCAECERKKAPVDSTIIIYDRRKYAWLAVIVIVVLLFLLHVI